MLNLLLVDDEKLELEALRQYVDWKKNGIDEVYTAYDGKSAHEIFLEHEIHIIITDIKMPVMDGITLAQKIYAMKTGAKIVFLSGYDDFAYLKAAMDVSAVDYIKKPFQIEAVERVIEKVKREIEKDQLVLKSMNIMENQLLKDICTSEKPEEKLIEQACSIHKEHGLSPVYGMVLVYGRFQQNIPDIIRGMMAEIEYGFVWGNTILFLVKSYVNYGDAAKRILANIKQVAGKECYAVCMRAGVPIEKFRTGFQILSSYEKIMFYEEVGDVFEVEHEAMATEQKWDSGEIRQLVDEIVDMVEKRNFDDRELLLDRLFNYFRMNFMPRQEVKNCLLRIILRIEDIDAASGNEIQKQGYSRELTEELEASFYFKRQEECMKNFFEKIAAYYAEKMTGKNVYVVNKVKKFIYENYANQITMEAIEEEIHLSKNYIRSIFKETTGETILEFITNYRFESACELLKDPSLKVKEVSMMVGYENVPYFCTIFTKRYKESPNEYRKHFI